MKMILKCLTIILLLSVAKTQAQTELTNYLKMGAENNPGLKSKFAEYNAELKKIPQVGTLPDPSFSFGIFIFPMETVVGPQIAMLGISQMFPWFGTLNASENVAVQMAKAKYEEFEDAKSKLFFEIKSAYYEVYFIKKGISITNENIGILNTFRQLALVKVQVGKASVVDELMVEMEINELKNQLAYLTDNKYALEVKFNNLLNSPDNSPVIVPDSLWSDSLSFSKEELLDSISTQNHQIKELEYKMQSRQKQEVVTKKLGMPQFTIGLDYTVIGKSSNPDIGSQSMRNTQILPTIGLSIPIYRKKYTAMRKEATLNFEATQFEKEEEQNQLTTSFENSFKEYKDAERRIKLYKEQLKLAQKSLSLLLTSYSTDGNNFEEVLRMERKVLEYALELDKAKADKNATVAFINYLTGK